MPLYEAVAFGQPAITNDVAPMNEITLDGVNGLLVSSVPDGTTRSGIAASAFDPEALAEAIDTLASDDDLRARLGAGAVELRDGDRAWERTVQGFEALLQMAAP